MINTRPATKPTSQPTTLTTIICKCSLLVSYFEDRCSTISSNTPITYMTTRAIFYCHTSWEPQISSLSLSTVNLPIYSLFSQFHRVNAFILRLFQVHFNIIGTSCPRLHTISGILANTKRSANRCTLISVSSVLRCRNSAMSTLFYFLLFLLHGDWLLWSVCWVSDVTLVFPCV
jgi:hypothetical protein